MRIPYYLPSAGLILRWIGLLAVVLAIVAGIVGMHGLKGVPTSSMATSGTGYATATADRITVQPTPASVPTACESDHPVTAASQAPLGLQLAEGCPPTACTHVMALHSDCTPNVSFQALYLPPPGTLTTDAAGTSLAPIPGHKTADRIPDTPSLEKLSISQT
ncbi:hypothetical protein ACX80D_09730 [Arthrobacter sp. Sr24]